MGLQAQAATSGVVRIQHQESTSIAGLTTQTNYKQFADRANDNKHKYINKKSEAPEPRFLFYEGVSKVVSGTPRRGSTT